eukprot:5527822-Pyramimonas_sp.AAC.1
MPTCLLRPEKRVRERAPDLEGPALPPRCLIEEPLGELVALAELFRAEGIRRLNLTVRGQPPLSAIPLEGGTGVGDGVGLWLHEPADVDVAARRPNAEKPCSLNS